MSFAAGQKWSLQGGEMGFAEDGRKKRKKGGMKKKMRCSLKKKVKVKEKVGVQFEVDGVHGPALFIFQHFVLSPNQILHMHQDVHLSTV